MKNEFTVEIGGRVIPLRYTVRELADMEEAIDTMDQFRDLILTGRKRLRNLCAAIRIMGNSALEHSGETGDLTDDWLLDSMDPRKIQTYQIAVLAAFTNGWKMETEEEREHDVVLEEIERKKDAGN